VSFIRDAVTVIPLVPISIPGIPYLRSGTVLLLFLSSEAIIDRTGFWSSCKSWPDFLTLGVDEHVVTVRLIQLDYDGIRGRRCTEVASYLGRYYPPSALQRQLEDSF